MAGSDGLGGGRFRITGEICSRAAGDGSTFHPGAGKECPVILRLPTMNQRPSFDDGVQLCLTRDARYPKEAYPLIRDALDHAQKLVSARDKRRGVGHLDGPEILEGFRDLALTQFGPLARIVLETWGLRATIDVGHIVFNLIEADVFSKSDRDQLADFDNVFDFTEAFDAPYRPLPAAAAVSERDPVR